MLFGIFVRSVEDGLEPSQTYDEVNKLLLFLTYVIALSKRLTLSLLVVTFVAWADPEGVCRTGGPDPPPLKIETIKGFLAILVWVP